jgi:N-acetylglucosaminyl-diphospho-decaprenol L-rhamnosyltransferase
MNRPLPPESAGAPRVSVVVVSFNTRDDLLACAASLEREVTLPFELVVVDNASADGSASAVESAHPTARVVRNVENVGFGRACNQGIRLSRASYVLLLNSDAEVRPGAIEALAGVLDAQPGAGAVGPRTLNADGTVQVSFGPDLTPWGEWRQRRLVEGVRRRDPRVLRRVDAGASREHEPGWVSGSCLLARRSALESVGLFDEGFFLYEEDADLCRRLRRAGWRIVFEPGAQVVHRLGQSSASDPRRSRLEYQRSHLLYYQKHNGVVAVLALRLWLVVAGARRARSARIPADRAEGRALLQLGLRGA